MDDRMLFSLLNLVGREVRVTKLNGCVLSGVFCATSVNKQDGDSQSDGDGLTLRYVHHLGGEKPSAEFGPRDRVKIMWTEIESVLAKKAGGPQGWDSSPEEVAATTLPVVAPKKKVEIDAKISLPKKAVAEREILQAVPKEWLTAPAPSPSAGRGDLNGNEGPGESFDQFRVNEAKFGVKSTYKEEFYTTELDRNKVTADQVARAERIAKEIEGASSTNAHVLEERGKKPLEDSYGDDEEAKYGAVLGSGGYEKYKPPAKRGASGQGSIVPKSSPSPNNANEQTGTPPPPPPTIAPKAPATSYASMVKGSSSATAASSTPAAPALNKASPTAASVPPPLQLKKPVAGAPPSSSATLTKKGSEGKTVVIHADQEKEKKSREDKIREFREFSQSFSSPSTKPSKTRGSPNLPDMNLEASPHRKPTGEALSSSSNQIVTKKDEGTRSTTAATTEPNADASVVETSAAPGANTTTEDTAKKPMTTTAAAAKKSLNPNAKNFNPTAPTFVPQGAGMAGAAVAGFPPGGMPQPTTVMMMPQPGGVPGGARPRMYQMPPVPPPVIPFQTVGGAPMFSTAPPMGGYVMPVPYAPNGRPMMYYQPPHPQMYAQQMLIPVQYATSAGTLPPPPMPQQVMPPLPPPASPQQHMRNASAQQQPPLPPPPAPSPSS